MPLDPDDVRTPPATTDEPTPADEPGAPIEPEAGLRSATDGSPRGQANHAPPSAELLELHRVPIEGPAPHPLQARLDAPVDTGMLEPDRGTQTAWMQAASAFTLELVRTAGERPAAGLIGAPGRRLAAQASVPIPERPLEGGVEAAIAKIGLAMQAGLETTGPGYLAYVPGGGLYATALANMIADAGNRYTGLSMAAPGCVRLEQDVLRWLLDEFGYGPEARGLLTSGGSMANLSALISARHHAFADSGDYSRAIVYTSAQAHHSIAKAVAMLGIPRANLRAVAVDPLFRLDPAALQRQLDADRHQGLRPFCVIASAGTTNTGAIDPLPELAQICADEDLWLHVDGAYGGCFQLCASGRARLRGIELADSICFDPHKGMFLPYGTGCLMVRDGARLAAAHAGEAEYLRDFDPSSDPLPSPADLGPELSRPFRGLRLWLPLMLHGAEAFRSALEEKLALAQLCADGLDTRVDAGAPLEIVAREQLSTLAFRLRKAPKEALEDYNRRNTDLLGRINAGGRTYLSSTLLPTADGPAVTLRVCILSFRTHRAHIEALLEDIDAGLAAESGPN